MEARKVWGSGSLFDVVTGGNRAMHAVLGGLYSSGPRPLAHRVAGCAGGCPWREAAGAFHQESAHLAKGFHFSLFNNGWGEQTTSNGSAVKSVPLPDFDVAFLAASTMRPSLLHSLRSMYG